MKEFIINFQYLFIGLTVFFGIALIGYIKGNREFKSVKSNNNLKENISVSDVSINDLESDIDNLN